MPGDKFISSRELFGPAQSRAIKDVLQSLFIGELISPSARLWMFFGWVSDIEIIDNRMRQFSYLQPDWVASKIKLSEVLGAILQKGSSVVLIVRDVDHNHQFANVLRQLYKDYILSNKLVIHLTPEEHRKGILGEDYLLGGSMNLTFNGITTNEENLVLRRDPAAIEEWRVTLEQKWCGILC